MALAASPRRGDPACAKGTLARPSLHPRVAVTQARNPERSVGQGRRHKPSGEAGDKEEAAMRNSGWQNAHPGRGMNSPIEAEFVTY